MERKPRVKLVEFVESILGKSNGGSVITSRESAERYFITRFIDTPASGSTTFMTLGLSEHRLTQSDSHVRQELLFAHYDQFVKMEAEKLVAAIAVERVASHCALFRGEILGPAGELGADTIMQSLYCSAPSYFPQALRVFDEKDYDPTVFVWLIPIHETEVDFVRTNGHEEFEILLEKRDPDLLDLHRASIV
jgi:hypothetical protein